MCGNHYEMYGLRHAVFAAESFNLVLKFIKILLRQAEWLAPVLHLADIYHPIGSFDDKIDLSPAFFLVA